MGSLNLRLTNLTTVFNAQASDTVSEVITKHFDWVYIEIATAALTDGSIKVRGTVDPSVDTTAARSTTNIWNYIGLYDTNLETTIVGSTGVAIGASGFRLLKVNIEGINKIGVEITGRTAGSYTAKIYGVNINGK